MGSIFMKWRNLGFLPFLVKVAELMLWLQMYEISSAIYGAANFSSLGPILSVPVALHESIVERYFKTLSFSILLILNLTLSGSLESQKSFSLL